MKISQYSILLTTDIDETKSNGTLSNCDIYGIAAGFSQTYRTLKFSRFHSASVTLT